MIIKNRFTGEVIIEVEKNQHGYYDLSGADLSGADLSWADLSGANLSKADITGANLSLCDLIGVKYDENAAFFALQCPEKGSFTAFKKCLDRIVELEIPADAKRSSATSRKCRCSKAKVVEITNIDGSESGLISIVSNYDPSFIYEVGKTVSVGNFNDDRWAECSSGIHFFITRSEAVNYG